MKFLILLFVFLSTAHAQSPWYFGTGEAVNLTNGIAYKNGVKNITGALNPTVTAVNAPAGSLYMSTSTNALYVKQDAGSSTNWLPLTGAPTGSALTFAGFDASGDLYSIPNWNIVDYLDGLFSSTATDGSSQLGVYRIGLQQTLGDDVSGDADSFSPLTSSSYISDNYDLDLYVGLREELNMDPLANVDDYYGISTTVDGQITNNGFSAYFNNLADVGGSYTSIATNTNATVTGLYQGIRMDMAGSAGSMYGISGVQQAAVGGQLELINLVNSGTIGSNFIALNLSNSGNVTTNIGGFQFSNTGTATNFTGASFFNDDLISNSFTGVAVTNTANGDVTASVQGFSFSSQGDSPSITGLNLSNSGVFSSSAIGVNVQDTSNSPSGDYRGINLNAAGTYDDLIGVEINLGSATASGTKKTGLTINDGAIVAGVNFTTTSSLPTVVDAGNILFTQFDVDSGSPITDTSVLSNNLSGASTFNDDFSGDPFFGLGYASVGFVGQVSVANTKTVDKLTMALGGGSVPASSTGGTINEAMMFNSRGLFAAGGTLNIDEMFHFRAGNGGCSFATDCYGISVEETVADNFLAKSLQIGGTRAPLDADTSLLLGSKKALRFTPMTTVERNGLSALESMLVYNDTTNSFDYYNGVSWQPITSGAGDVTGPASSVDSEIVLFDGLTGKLIKAATGSGFVKSTSGVYSTQTSIDLTADVGTSILPLANGGTNKNMTAVNGGIVYTDANSQEVSAAGTSGQILRSGGAGAPTWSDPSAIPVAVRTESADYTATATDSHIRVDATGAARTITLPTAVGITGRKYTIKKIDSSVNTVTVDGDGAETVDGSANFVLLDQYDSIEIISNGTGWDIL